MQTNRLGSVFSGLMKKVFIWSGHGLTVVVLFTLPTTFLLTFIFLQPGVLKNTLQSSGTYKSFSKLIVDASMQAVSSSTSTYGVSQEAVKRAAEETFTPDQLQNKTEDFIDRTFTWLDGKKPTLRLDVNLADEQKIFANKLSKELSKSISSKPVCSTQQLQQISQSADPSTILNAPCRPENIDATQFEQLFQSSAEKNQSLPQDAQVGSVVEKTPEVVELKNEVNNISVPLVFHIVKNGFYILLGFLILLLGALYLIVKNPVDFMQVVARPFITTGILLAIYTLLSQWLFEQNILGKITNSASQSQAFDKASHAFVLMSMRTTLVFAVIYIVLGVVFAVFAYKDKQKKLIEMIKKDKNSKEQTEEPSVQTKI